MDRQVNDREDTRRKQAAEVADIAGMTQPE